MKKAAKFGRKAKNSARQHPWFNPMQHYETRGQTYHTFATKAPHEIQKAIRSIVEKPEKVFAVEFGPGTDPLIDKFPFERRLFVDSSNRILAMLKHSMTAKREAVQSSEMMQEDIRQVRRIKNRAGKFGLAIANEVLTHIPPKQRINVITGLADNSERIVLTDRYEKVPGLHGLNISNAGAEYVDPKPIAKSLMQKGFEVEIWLYPWQKTDLPESYFIITARKSKNPKLTVLPEKKI